MSNQNQTQFQIDPRVTLQAVFSDNFETSIPECMLVNINNELIEVRQHPEQDGFFCLNDIFRATELDNNKRPSKFLTSKKVDSLPRGCQEGSKGCQTVSQPSERLPNEFFTERDGKTQVTFANEEICFGYIDWLMVDEGSERAGLMSKSYARAAKGDVSGAMDAALEVVVMPVVMDKVNSVYNQINSLIPIWSTDQGMQTEKATALIWKIIGESITNIKSGDNVSMIECFIVGDEVKGVGEFIKVCELCISLLHANVESDVIKRVIESV